jgi:hypothetical protein
MENTLCRGVQDQELSMPPALIREGHLHLAGTRRDGPAQQMRGPLTYQQDPEPCLRTMRSARARHERQSNRISVLKAFQAKMNSYSHRKISPLQCNLHLQEPD